MRKIISSVLLSPMVITGFCQYTTNNTMVYNAFRDNQFNFPKPKAIDTIDVGIYNFQTNSFVGLHSIEIKIGRTIQLRPENIKSESPIHVLKFKVDNYAGVFSVSINGVNSNNLPGTTEIYVQIRHTPVVNWKIRVGNQDHQDKFNVIKLPFTAAGVFKIPLLPIVILYEPPKDQAGSNHATYSHYTYATSSIGVSFTDESSTTKPGEFTDFDTFQGLLAAAGSALSSSDDPYASAAGSVLGVLNNALGSHSSAVTNGTVKNKELTLSSTDIFGDSLNTLPNDGGPGIGDVFICLRDARFLWLIKDNSFFVTLLDYNTKPQISAHAIKELMHTGEDSLIYQSVAQYDPFIKFGASASLPGNRYVLSDIIESVEAGSYYTYGVTHQISQSDKNVAIRFSTTVEDFESGFLSSFGLSPYTETKTIKTTISNSMTNQAIIGEVVSASVTIGSLIGEKHKIYECYYDNVFGTFAVKLQTNSIEPTHTGIYRDIYGNPKPNSQVLIKYGSKKFVTYTNTKGEYKFYSPELKNYKPPGIKSVKGTKKLNQ